MAELQEVLSSPLFSRAPSLAQLLRYICQKHFAGETHQIKEQHIAVEALGRPEPFDQKRDSIVRVELHRLRKRLRQYYETEGAAHPIEITIPAGGYAPRFTAKAGRAETPVPQAQAAAVEAPPPPPAATPARSRFNWRALAALFGLQTVLALALLAGLPN